MKSNSTQSGISKELQLPISQQVTTIASNSPIYFYQYNLKVVMDFLQLIRLICKLSLDYKKDVESPRLITRYETPLQVLELIWLWESNVPHRCGESIVIFIIQSYYHAMIGVHTGFFLNEIILSSLFDNFPSFTTCW